jgi:hypothetical protein
MRVLTALVVTALIHPAVAGPDDSALRETGRQLERRGKHAEAIAAFEAYLKAHPDDVAINAELGFSAYQAKDYPRAEAATRKAIARAPMPAYANDPAGRPRGAAFYNLGLILEAVGKPRDAAMAYADSLRARPSRVVRERLQKLDATLAAAVDPLGARPLAGPFDSIDDACRDQLKRAGEDPDGTWGENESCTRAAKLAVERAKLASPYEDLIAFQSMARSDLQLAVRTNHRWYLTTIVGKQDRWSSHCGGTRFRVRTATMVKRVVPELRVEYSSFADGCEHGGNGHSRTWGWDERGTVIVGIGPSGTPSALPPIPTQLTEWQQVDDGKRQKLTEASLVLTLSADGSLDAAGKITHPALVANQSLGPEDLDGENVLGHHTTAFP